MKVHLHKYLVVLIIVIISFKFNYETINEFPQFVHCWAQCDRYSIALGFLDNGGDFFHPQTFVYNKQFPGEFTEIQNTTISSVDFPIHDYTVSILMRLFNNTEPWCFKIYTLFYSMLGLFYLYKLSLLFTKSISKSIFVLLFAISSPVFLYYQSGFLPTIPSLANALIGLYFFFKHLKNNSKKEFVIALFFITLATLARLPFSIILVAITCFESFYFIKNKKINWHKMLFLIGSFSVIFIYFIYNLYLRNKYGSLFLNSLLYAQSFKELLDFINFTIEKWGLHYFSLYHYLIVIILLLIFIFNIVLKKIKLSAIERQLAFFVMILFIGCILYYFAMSFQFINHDYYFLDSWYLPFILMIIFLVTSIPDLKNKKLMIIIYSISTLIWIPIFMHANSIALLRRTFFSPNPTAERFKNAEELLISLKISKDSKILVLNEDGPNNPFILMKRKGYCVIWPEPKKIESALTWPFDYVVIDNSKLLNTIYLNYPEIKNKLVKIGGNEKISIYIKNEQNENCDLKKFLNLNLFPIQYNDKITFDFVSKNISNTDSLSQFSLSGKNAGIVTIKQEYGFTYKFPKQNYLKRPNTALFMGVNFYSENNLKDLLVCVAINNKDKALVFLAKDLSSIIKNGKWDKQELIFSLPQINEQEVEIVLFIWNRGKNTVIYDDIELTIY